MPRAQSSSYALSDNLREVDCDICEKPESAVRPLTNRTRRRTASHIERANNPRRGLGPGGAIWACVLPRKIEVVIICRRARQLSVHYSESL